MLQIYDDQHRRIAGIDDPDDLKIEKTLSSGDKQISFSYPKTGSEIEICGLNIISGQKMMNMF